MLSLRTLRAQAPAARTLGRRAPRARFQSTNSNATASRSHIATGVASGTAAALVSYGIYTFTPSGRVQRRINGAVYEADRKYREAAAKFRQKTPDTEQALDQLREIAYSYAAFIPGGRSYVDTAFHDLNTLREGHGDEVDKIVRETYEELKEVSKGSLSIDTVRKSLDTLHSFLRKIGQVAADGFSDIINNHPQLRDQLGPGVDQLKGLGERLGPEAKKEVDQTWHQVSEVLQSGFSLQNVERIRRLVQEKIEKVRKLGDKAWTEGMEQAKPMLDENPKIKQLVEENAGALKQGNASELFHKVKESTQSGNLDDLKSYVEKTVNQVRHSSGGSGGLEGSLSMIPGASELMPKIQTISNLSGQKTSEAEQLMKETVEKLKEVLTEQSQKAEKLVQEPQK